MRKTLYILIFLFTLCLVSCKDDVKVVAQKPRIFPEYNVALDEIIRSKEQQQKKQVFYSRLELFQLFS